MLAYVNPPALTRPWDPRFLGILVSCAVMDFTAARRIEQTDRWTPRRAWLTVSLGYCFGMLLAMKYHGVLAAGRALGKFPYRIVAEAVAEEIRRIEASR